MIHLAADAVKELRHRLKDTSHSIYESKYIVGETAL